ncbi:MAG: hypothetical protein ABJH05_05505 [Fulvivirga sp.]
MKTLKLKMMKSKRLQAMLIFSALILSVPLIAMQFTDEVDWSVFDFLIGAVLLTSLSLGVETVFRNINDFYSRIIFCVIILVVFFLVWAELAVGVFGTPFAGS